MGLHKILKIVALILSVVGVVFLAMIVSKGDDAVKATGYGLDGFLYVAYIIFSLILLMVIIFVLKGIFAGDIKKTLISVGLFLAIIAISYVLSSGADASKMPLVDGKQITESASKWVGTGLHAFYIIGIVAIGSMVLSGIKKITK